MGVSSASAARSPSNDVYTPVIFLLFAMSRISIAVRCATSSAPPMPSAEIGSMTRFRAR